MCGHALSRQSIITLPTKWMRAAGHILAKQVRGCALFRREQHVGDRIGQHPVHLFGHGPVAAPQPRLDVRQQRPGSVRVLQLGRGEGARQRGVDVADHDDGRGPMLHQGGLEPLQHAAGLGAVRRRANRQRDVRRGKIQLPEEHVRHRFVVVLARVDDSSLDVRHSAETLVQRRDLHEVGPRTGHDEDLAHRGQLASRSWSAPMNASMAVRSGDHVASVIAAHSRGSSHPRQPQCWHRNIRFTVWAFRSLS